MLKFESFVIALTALADQDTGEIALVDQCSRLLAGLVCDDDWLAPAFAEADAQRYRQYLMHRDERNRFSVVSFVWGPGQKTPMHDHRVWGLIGMLRGAEIERRYRREANGELVLIKETRLERGDVAMVSPSSIDIHEVFNGHSDRTSISIHVYGADIGAVKRATYDAATGAESIFVSGYSTSK